MNPVATRTMRLAMLDRLVAVGGPLADAQLVLVKEPFTHGPALAPADLVLADFDGYAAEAALVYGSAYVAPDGTTRVAPPTVQFEATGATTPNTIHGWAVLNAGGTAVLYSALLDEPVAIEAADDGVIVLPEYVLDV